MKHESTNEPVACDDYDMIDRLLRNNLDDDGYAMYSNALDRLYTHPQDQKKDEALRLALKELKTWQRFTHGQNEHTNEAITLIEQVLENK